jgi:excisionase family DNA binding protein
MSSTYMTPKEVAEELRVTPAAVYHWIALGKLRAVRVGTSVRVVRDSFNAFVQPIAPSQEAR